LNKAFFAAAHESVCGQTDALTQMRPQRSRADCNGPSAAQRRRWARM